jgi:hypothetical protein
LIPLAEFKVVEEPTSHNRGLVEDPTSQVIPKAMEVVQDPTFHSLAMDEKEISLRIFKVLEVAEISISQDSEVDLHLFPRRAFQGRIIKISSGKIFRISEEIFKELLTMTVARDLINSVMIIRTIVMTDNPDTRIHYMIMNVNVSVIAIVIVIVIVIVTAIVIAFMIVIEAQNEKEITQRKDLKIGQDRKRLQRLGRLSLS